MHLIAFRGGSHAGNKTSSWLMTAQHQLGSVVFERRPSARELRTMLIFSGLLFCFGIGAMIGALLSVEPPKEDEPGREQLFITSAVMFCGSVAMLGGYWFSSRGFFRCFEYGIGRSSPWREVVLPFAAIETFSFRRQPEYKQGELVSTSYFLQFDPACGSGYSTIIFAAKHVPPEDQQFEQIEQHVSNFVAAKMAEALRTCGIVAWTPQMRILPDGIEFQGLTAWQMLPWHELGQPQLTAEVFKLFGSRGGPPLLEVNPAQPNFYAGLLLAVDKFNQARARHQPAL
jgi:hypothetical protein